MDSVLIDVCNKNKQVVETGLVCDNGSGNICKWCLSLYIFGFKIENMNNFPILRSDHGHHYPFTIVHIIDWKEYKETWSAWNLCIQC